jgi:hypothetical protein
MDKAQKPNDSLTQFCQNEKNESFSGFLSVYPGLYGTWVGQSPSYAEALPTESRPPASTGLLIGTLLDISLP